MQLSRKIRRFLSNGIKGKTPKEQMRMVQHVLHYSFSEPYSGEELELAEDIGSNALGPFFHGGAPGLTEILPGEVTGIVRWEPKGRNLNKNKIYAPDRFRWAFFSQSLEVATKYADSNESGKVYLVQPVGPVLPDMQELRAFQFLGSIPGSFCSGSLGHLNYRQTVEVYGRVITSYCAESALVLDVIE